MTPRCPRQEQAWGQHGPVWGRRGRGQRCRQRAPVAQVIIREQEPRIDLHVIRPHRKVVTQEGHHQHYHHHHHQRQHYCEHQHCHPDPHHTSITTTTIIAIARLSPLSPPPSPQPQARSTPASTPAATPARLNPRLQVTVSRGG
ncbi:uncharacterized histidine-rich protein DDB_G0274557-like [Lepus europaeus]|uniref:uncharacterized histidine-rich protein DDB_G0274557-like n=1 Tax=Lepus europaeus TaxID=9983 RepID=UPI002B4692D5|nr:uncharacterized histidine-rich protein DDB_G0274557-like [Lepus europaeus]